MMSEKEAKAIITQIAPLGTMDYSLTCRKAPTINKNYGLSLPVPPVTLGIGIFAVVLLITRVMLGCYVY